MLNSVLDNELHMSFSNADINSWLFKEGAMEPEITSIYLLIEYRGMDTILPSKCVIENRIVFISNIKVYLG